MDQPTLKQQVLRTPSCRKVWRRLFGETSWVRRAGTFREQEAHCLIDRPQYAYGLLRAADTAAYFGKRSVTACEFGVATGNGLLNLIEVSQLIEAETGVEFRLVGFDTGAGLPAVKGFKDHAEIWSPGDFSMEDPSQLKQRLNGDAELILGDIHDTIGDFVDTLTPDCPLGFVAVDVDIYSATKATFAGLNGPAEVYLPAMSFYFDDVLFYFANESCGELCAIAEHNRENEHRKIHPDRSVPGMRPVFGARWYASMYVCHVLDHPDRNVPRTRDGMSLGQHMELMSRLR